MGLCWHRVLVFSCDSQTPDSADWTGMLRRLMGEFSRRLAIQQGIPDQPDALLSAFPSWLYMAGAKGAFGRRLNGLVVLDKRSQAAVP